MSIMKFVKTLTLTAVLGTAIAFAQTPYDEGQKALRDQNWTEAAAYFKDAIEADRKTADASMYWRAHALYKAGRNSEAERQVRSLERKYPDSRWVKEAQVLIIEHGGAGSNLAVSGEASLMDDDLRMFALAQLMEQDPQRALPMVLEMIESTDSESVSSDLLFMLGMSDNPEARKQIARIARDSNKPRLQADAVQMLGIASDQSSMELLVGLYRDSDSNEVKEAVIQAHIVSDQSGTLVEIFESEKDPGLQVEIIHALGVMDATDDLEKLYPTLTSQKTRVAALEAFSIAGDTTKLKKVLDTETDPALRKTAIHGIAMEDDADAAEVLESLYDNAASVEEKRVVLEALVMMDDAQELALKVARTEKDLDLRRQAIHMLGVMEATDEVAGLYSEVDQVELRKAVLESMLIMDDAKGLIDLLKIETDLDRKREILQMLSLVDSKEANEYMFQMLENKK